MLLLAYSHILSPSQSCLPHPHAHLHLCSNSPLFLVDEANPQPFHGFCESLFSSSSKIFQILLFVTQIQVFLLSLFSVFFFFIWIVNLMVILHWLCVKLQMEDWIDRLSHWIRLISWIFSAIRVLDDFLFLLIPLISMLISLMIMVSLWWNDVSWTIFVCENTCLLSNFHGWVLWCHLWWYCLAVWRF